MEDDLTLAEAAFRLRRNRELVRQWLKASRLAGRKRAGRWFVSQNAVARFAEQEPVRRRRPPHAS